MENALPASPTPRPVTTVLGPIAHTHLGITDAHNHVWIERVPGADPAAPVLDRYDAICAELQDYRAAGGGALLDCQPGGCGRDANRLVDLARASGVHIIACTGFHRRRYYPADYGLFADPAEKVCAHFTAELTGALQEARGRKTQAHAAPVRAGFIKLAVEASWSETPQAALEASAAAARQTGAMLAIHTEKGALAEKIVYFYQERGVAPAQVVLCHMDKRPDIGLHKDLARFGALLEYDTFYRPKYDPENRLWPLIEKMVEAGLGASLALATDMAEAEMYRRIGGGPGLASLPGAIRQELARRGIPEEISLQMLGGNIARRLAGIS